MTSKKVTISVSSGGGSPPLKDGGGFLWSKEFSWSLDQDPSNFNPSESGSTPMTDDLVKRLRDFEQWLREPAGKNLTLSSDLFDEAADRIEAQDKRNKELETALRKIAELEYKYAAINGAAYHAHKIASAALAGEKKDD